MRGYLVGHLPNCEASMDSKKTFQETVCIRYTVASVFGGGGVEGRRVGGCRSCRFPWAKARISDFDKDKARSRKYVGREREVTVMLKLTTAAGE